MKEIRVHGRGGQGVVLASEIFVGALIKEGKYAASFPFFGFERRGAPIVAFARFDERPIWQKDQIYAPDCVVVMDSTLLKAVDVYQGLKPGGVVVLNACRDIETLDLPPEVEQVGLVDATAICLDTLKAFIPNTAGNHDERYLPGSLALLCAGSVGSGSGPRLSDPGHVV